MEHITREELVELLESDSGVKLVMALGAWAYRAKHIPGSVSFDSPEAAAEALDRDDDIVVYCSGESCHASAFAAEWLERHGFRHVRRYVGGLLDWEDAGLPLEGEMVRPPSTAASR